MTLDRDGAIKMVVGSPVSNIVVMSIPGPEWRVRLGKLPRGLYSDGTQQGLVPNSWT